MNEWIIYLAILAVYFTGFNQGRNPGFLSAVISSIATLATFLFVKSIAGVS